MLPLPAGTGYFVLAAATALAVLDALAEGSHDLTMVIWALLVVGAVIVAADRGRD